MPEMMFVVGKFHLPGGGIRWDYTMGGGWSEGEVR